MRMSTHGRPNSRSVFCANCCGPLIVARELYLKTSRFKVGLFQYEALFQDLSERGHSEWATHFRERSEQALALDRHGKLGEWIEAWNSHDLDRILTHYSDDVEITTPMIKIALGNDSGSLKGKEAVGVYWRQALIKLPDLHFELLDVATSVDSIALYYKSVMNKNTVEVMFFNEDGEVNKIIAHYT